MMLSLSKPMRLRKFFTLLAMGFGSYLIDCCSGDHPELPWFEKGINAGGLAGFYLTLLCIIAALGCLFSKKGK
jgi:hypothetical protein